MITIQSTAGPVPLLFRIFVKSKSNNNLVSFKSQDSLSLCIASQLLTSTFLFFHRPFYISSSRMGRELESRPIFCSITYGLGARFTFLN